MSDWLESGGSWVVLILVGILFLAAALMVVLLWPRRPSPSLDTKKPAVRADSPPPPGKPSAPLPKATGRRPPAPQPAAARPSSADAPGSAARPAPPEIHRQEGVGAASEPPRDIRRVPADGTIVFQRKSADDRALATPPPAPAASQAPAPVPQPAPSASTVTVATAAAAAAAAAAASARRPMPEASASAPAAGAGVGDDKGAYVAVTVHYGTDRKDTGVATELAARFTSDRALISNSVEPISYGTCVVSIPKSHAVGGLEDRTWWQWATWQDRAPDKHVLVLTVTPETASAFFSTLKAAVTRSTKKDAFVFVHGFSVSFADAARRTAQMAYDMNFQGAPVMFTWPTPDLVTSILTAYTTSESNADLSKHRFRQFLRDLLEKSGATTVHIIAHSMGNRLVTEALQMLDTVDTAHLKSKIGEVILTAPDIDASVFITEIAPRLTRLSSRITLYASSKDKALDASKGVHSFPRIGEFQSMMSVPLGIDVIDASSVYDDAVGHSYYGDSEPVIGDLCYLLSFGDRAAKRSLTLAGALTPGGQACWSVIKKPLSDVYAAIAARGHV